MTKGQFDDKTKAISAKTPELVAAELTEFKKDHNVYATTPLYCPGAENPHVMYVYYRVPKED